MSGTTGVRRERPPGRNGPTKSLRCCAANRRLKTVPGRSLVAHVHRKPTRPRRRLLRRLTPRHPHGRRHPLASGQTAQHAGADLPRGADDGPRLVLPADPKHMADASWQQRVDALSEGRWRRYDERTATQLGEGAEQLIDRCDPSCASCGTGRAGTS